MSVYQDGSDDYDGCMCGERDCPECGGNCTHCNGEGIIDGSELGDPERFDPDSFVKCPNCGGSGNGRDMTFW